MDTETTELSLWRNLVNSISAGHLPFRLEVRQKEDRILLHVKLGVKDSQDGHDTYAGTSFTLPPFPTGNLHPSVLLRQAEGIVYAVVERVWLHELREHWSVRGERTRDPHRQTKSDGVTTPFDGVLSNPVGKFSPDFSWHGSVDKETKGAK
jgi:hypothetical protein